MIEREELERMSNTDIKTIDKNSLIDINTIEVNKTLPTHIRIEKYIDQIKNPYCYKCGDTVVKIQFKSDGQPLDTIITNLLTDKKYRSE